MLTPNFNLRGYADAKPSEAIQPHQLPGLAVAVVFPGKPGTDLIELPIKQFKDYKPKAKGNAARRVGADTVDGLRELYATFKSFDLWSTTNSAGYIRGATQIWSVPDDARAFIIDRAKTR